MEIVVVCIFLPVFQKFYAEQKKIKCGFLCYDRGVVTIVSWIWRVFRSCIRGHLWCCFSREAQRIERNSCVTSLGRGSRAASDNRCVFVVCRFPRNMAAVLKDLNVNVSGDCWQAQMVSYNGSPFMYGSGINKTVSSCNLRLSAAQAINCNATKLTICGD